MSSRSVLQGDGGRRRGRPRRRRRGRRDLLAAAALAVLAFLLIAGGIDRRSGAHTTRHPVRNGDRPAPAAPPDTEAQLYATTPDPAVSRVHIRFKHPPRSALLWDVDTGTVLYGRDPQRILPIASLTKMMTALLVVDREPPDARVLITKAALAYKGSGVGILPKGKRVRLETLLYGLLLPSGNDAAIALAQRTAGTVPRFIAEMNAKARALGLLCTHFSSVDGFEDADNHSCAPDLAVMAREMLRRPRLARIVGRRRAVLPFPVKGGHIDLFNNNPLYRLRYPGTTGVKTGYTDKAGHSLVATARRHGVTLGVVLLHSPDTGSQASRLLDQGFAARGVGRRSSIEHSGSSPR